MSTDDARLLATAARMGASAATISADAVPALLVSIAAPLACAVAAIASAALKADAISAAACAAVALRAAVMLDVVRTEECAGVWSAATESVPVAVVDVAIEDFGGARRPDRDKPDFVSVLIAGNVAADLAARDAEFDVADPSAAENPRAAAAIDKDADELFGIAAIAVPETGANPSI